MRQEVREETVTAGEYVAVGEADEEDQVHARARSPSVDGGRAMDTEIMVGESALSPRIKGTGDEQQRLI
jgi:hypothetical protein